MTRYSLANHVDDIFLTSILDLLPFQMFRGIKYLIFNLPGDILAYMRYIKEQKEEEAKEEERMQAILEEQRRIAEEPKKARKRKTFVAPKKEKNEEEDLLDTVEDEEDIKAKQPDKPKYVSGGLWTDEDLGELAKLCSKFPGGTPERWEKISDALRRPVPEVTFMAKKVRELACRDSSILEE